jgi:predicted amidophosphoribosyltransferase
MNVLVRLEKQQIDESSLRLLGAVLADYVAHHTPLPAVIDAIVPVPTSRDREERRGGSIPYGLAATLRDQLAVPLREVLVQVAPHLDHTEASGPERRRALRRAWRAKADTTLLDRTVLLVDDIVTTGTTLVAAAELLSDVGVGRVYGLALMHTERST